MCRMQSFDNFTFQQIDFFFLNIRKCEQLKVVPYHSFWESVNFDFEKIMADSQEVITPKVATELRKIEIMSKFQDSWIDQLLQEENTAEESGFIAPNSSPYEYFPEYSVETPIPSSPTPSVKKINQFP